jgi:hypothetical protein
MSSPFNKQWNNQNSWSKRVKKYLPYIIGALIVAIVIWALVSQAQEYYQYDPMLALLKDRLRPVHPIVEKLKLYKGDKSYTINKERVFLCLYDEHGEYYPLNHQVYVLLHELAHVINTKDVGHTEEFHRIFDELLDRATKLGIYNPDIPVVMNYCNY